MDAQFADNTRNALLQLYTHFNLDSDQGAYELRKTLEFKMHDSKALFGASWRIANGARRLSDEADDLLRVALVSLALIGYEFCAGADYKFERSRDEALELLGDTHRLESEEILLALQAELGSSEEEIATYDDAASASGTGNIASWDDGDNQSLSDTGRHPKFARPHIPSFSEEFKAFVGSFEQRDAVTEPSRQRSAIKAFNDQLKQFMRVADQGRTFTETQFLTSDLELLTPYLEGFHIVANPRELLRSAVTTRQFAKRLDFKEASAADYQCARLAWLLSAYWNSLLLTYHWESNLPNVAYDFLGYLALTQAEIRYSEAEFLLLLRVCFSITRIATCDDLIPLQFLDAGADDLRRWLRHTIGTVLATAGPGRVAPSRVKDDPRLPQNRQEFASVLLRTWETAPERAAAATLLLEMGGWDAGRAMRLVGQVFVREAETAELEVWRRVICERSSNTQRVRVVRPNPWRPGTGALITVEEEAIASLAADVLSRFYPVLDGDVSLSGHSFRTRRVPTFVCSAEFGPLGLFKVDTSERIEREVKSFARFAQRLHPRYRAGRCDQSLTVITEPDDEKHFVRGVMTSYVFTQEEAPQTLAGWLPKAAVSGVERVCTELFGNALQPWYEHAKITTVDAFAEFPILTPSGIDRLVDECGKFHRIDLNDESTPGSATVKWIRMLLGYLEGSDSVATDVADVADRLQVLRSYRSVCHGDLHLDNILVIGRDGAEYPCIIDFEATHQGYILKDCFRFIGSILARTAQWSHEEASCLRAAMSAAILGNPLPTSSPTENVERATTAIRIVLANMSSTWRGGDGPPTMELAISAIAGLLPFARYPDTRPGSSRTLLEICDEVRKTL